MEQEQESPLSKSVEHISPPKATLGSLIDSIQFIKKPKVKSTLSETDSISSNHSADNKQKSKVWTQQQIELFHILLKKYGTDFHILSSFFPKKTKNQLKNRYKQYINIERKKDREESNKLKAVSLLFQEQEIKQQKLQKLQKIEEMMEEGIPWKQ